MGGIALWAPWPRLGPRLILANLGLMSVRSDFCDRLRHRSRGLG